MAQGNIEVWLQALVDGMQATVKGIIKRAHTEVNEQDLETFIFSHPAQISLLGIQFLWTGDMQSALTQAKQDKTIMNKTMKKTDAILKEMIVITTRATLGKNERKNLETCITVHVHQRDTSEAGGLFGTAAACPVHDFFLVPRKRNNVKRTTQQTKSN